MFSIHRRLFLALKKGSNHQNHSSSGSLHLVKESPPVKFQIPSPPPQTPYRYLEDRNTKNFMASFCWWSATDSRLYRATIIRQFTFYQKFLMLIKSISEGWKAWSHPVVLNLCINLFITKYKLKSQYVKLTQLWPLTVKWVLSLIWQAYQKYVSFVHM